VDQTVKNRVAIYARVSTTDQTAENQILDLEAFCATRGWTIKAKFVDTGISGAKDDRPQLNAMMDLVRKHKFDAVLVWALDRFARSMKHLVLTLDELRDLKVDFISYKQNIDTSTSQGRLMFHVIAGMAEFERELIRERVLSGIRRVQSKGVKLGRPEVPAETRARVLELRKQGLSLSQIAAQVLWVRASGKYGARKEVPLSKAMVGKILAQEGRGSSTKHRQNVA
jgi:DNA invertase Pin-like site-specific DNA recombinase